MNKNCQLTTIHTPKHRCYINDVYFIQNLINFPYQTVIIYSLMKTVMTFQVLAEKIKITYDFMLCDVSNWSRIPVYIDR